MVPLDDYGGGQARARLTIRIQRRLTKPFHMCGDAASCLFAGIGKQGCLPPRQIIKAALDYRNLGTVRLGSMLLHLK
jgi:hypothetical protein